MPLRSVANYRFTHVWAGEIFGMSASPTGWTQTTFKIQKSLLKGNATPVFKEHMVVSFRVISIFTEVLLEDMLQLLSHHFHDQTIILIRQALTTTYFL
jgi:hypothetical protein